MKMNNEQGVFSKLSQDNLTLESHAIVLFCEQKSYFLTNLLS